VTTSYYLLLLKHIRNGGKSIADISSDEFQHVPIGKRPNLKPTSNQENTTTPLITDYLNLEMNQNQLKEMTAPINIKKYCNTKSHYKCSKLVKKLVLEIVLQKKVWLPRNVELN